MMDPRIAAVTDRIRERSHTGRTDYLAGVQAMLEQPDSRDRHGCANLAHAWAALPSDDRLRIRTERAPNLAVVTAYNDMLSAHQPYAGYPDLLREQARRLGATLQVAGGVPAMCDGVTQGMPGMELSLFSRDVIAQGTAVALSHQMYNGALLLGICDKIVPGLLIGALHFGHLPCVFVPAGPMPSGLSNTAKSAVRVAHAKGEASRDELLDAELAAYHSPGTCTFYGTANSNQMLLEAMGLQLPNASFVAPNTPARDALSREAVARLLAICDPAALVPIGQLVDERCIVNAMVALLATGGSTNHLIHWVAVARAAGILIDWSDFDELSGAVPLLARVYPNGKADVNDFQQAGGPAFVIRELLDAGLMHDDVQTIHAGGLRRACSIAPERSADVQVLRPVAEPFDPHGGLRLLDGNLGRAVIKISAVPAAHHRVEAPARVFDSQEAVLAAFERGELTDPMVVVVRFQGPAANGMPELHKLTPVLTAMQDAGLAVALLTDGRMSGASGRVPAAIHLTPETVNEGALGRLRDGDPICLDAAAGQLNVLLDEAQWQARKPATLPVDPVAARMAGRALFSGLRARALGAEQGACTWL